MKKYLVVYLIGKDTSYQSVLADGYSLEDGFLVFYREKPGSTFSERHFVFAPGMWIYVKVVDDDQ